MYKPEWLSEGAELLVERCEHTADPYDVVIVGSGYGGAVAAARLAGAQDTKTGRTLKVCVLERGREHLPGTFPNNFSELPGHVRFSRFDDPEAKGVADGLFDLRIGKDVTVLVANGLGGGSLINAGIAAAPAADIFENGWPRKIRDEFADAKVVAERYRRAAERLGAELAEVEATGEYQRLEKHFAFVDLMRRHNPRRASVTVNQDSCKRCGDCATGCNVGAKKTLSSTYLHEARARGAEIYTGASVFRLDKDPGGWIVYYSLTEQPRPLQEKPLCAVRARNVILAAGALGSTEILLRSQASSRDLRFSGRLGESFSTNGDMISALYGGEHPVNAAAKESEPLKNRHVGPTITSIAVCGSSRADRVVVEELAIPGALRNLFGEVVTTSAMLANFARRDEDGHRAFSDHDPGGRPGGVQADLPVEPLAVDEAMIDRCQVFATMGDDGARGRLELVPGWETLPERSRARDGAIRVDWPGAGAHPIYAVQDGILSRLAHGRATYLRNPLWQPIPPEVSQLFSGAKPSGLLFSVHPLGGCPMGDDAEHGVVDHMGRVFDPATGDVHSGLLVLDGSIVPTALAINPLLTITVLAERAIELYCEGRWTRPATKPVALTPPPLAERPPAKESVTALRFSERATGNLRLAAGASPVEAALDFEFQEMRDLRGFLADARHALPGKGTLTLQDPFGEAIGKPCRISGEVELLVRGASTARERIWSALCAYARTRLLADARAYVSAWLSGGRPSTGADRSGGRPAEARRPGFLERWRREGFWLALLDSFEIGRGYITLASQIGEVRHLLYELRLGSDFQDPAGHRLEAGTTIRGRKTLRYAAGENPWRQLVDLKLTAYPAAGKPFEMGVLTVDLGHFFHGFDTRLRISRQRDLPAAWMDLASLALFVGRVILKAHFWSFRLPDYQKYDPMRDVRRLPGELPGLRMQRYLVGYPALPEDAGVFLPVTRYRDGTPSRHGPVLLIHGLGASGNQFCTSRVSPNLAQHLADRGFDVWVAELRTSIALPYSADQWTIDEVACNDIPRIVETVLEETGARQLDVVAHCIGSAMFCTAVLGGKLQHSAEESKIRSAVLLQVGPLVTLSKGTRLRALAIAPLRRLVPTGHLDFSVDDRAGWLESLVDRVLATYPYPAREARHHRLGWSRRRARHIANCNRWAAIDGRMFSHDNLSARMLDGLGEVLGHASITTWEQALQYALLERLTDWEGSNAYVTAENIRRFFTFPVRFLHGSENDVFHPLTSWRSRELLRRVHGRDFPAEVVLLPGYGHLDPLIGKAADHDVFPHVSAFLGAARQPWVPQPQADDGHYHLRRPLVGPVVGWLRRAANGWRVRIWCRLDDLRSPISYALVQVCADGRCGPAERIPCGGSITGDDKLRSLVAGPLDTVLCVDVDLASGASEFEIVVRSAHGAIDEELVEEHRLAEASAGVPVSQRRPVLAAQLFASAPEPQKLAELMRPGVSGEGDKIGAAMVSIPEKSRDVTFFVASCRYPGWIVDREMADAAFKRLRDVLDARREPAAGLFLIGDQIYADATAGVFDPKDCRERYYDGYREAWSAPHARSVLSRVPTYMMMDDHEAGDNWHPKDMLSENDVAMRKDGLKAYERYQWLHSPGNRAQRKRRLDGSPAYYYSFDLHGIPVFVCDTRTGREGRQFILDPGQFGDLLSWLRGCKPEELKLVVSPSVVVPFLKTTKRPAYAARSDGWDGFHGPLHELFSTLARETQNVVFLCGDAHLSLSSEIWFEREGQRVGGTCYCIVASPMYAPYPFANATLDEFLLDNVSRPLKLSDGVSMRYRVIADSVDLGGGFSAVTAPVSGPPIVTVHGAKQRSFALEPGCAVESAHDRMALTE
jgi:choline dehydrogenase-like flavoprotein/alpha-beta hydrolase superfamily lysophospholipase